jgi:Short C-terminal domain
MGPDMIQQLKDLAALKDQGVLTDEEFAAQKARILGT